MTSFVISLILCILYSTHLWILIPETMTFNVKRIASSLGSSIEKLALPLDASKCMQVTMWSADDVSSYDCIQVQLRRCPQTDPLRRDPQLIAKVGSDPLRQLGWKPSQDRVLSAVCVGNVVLPWCAIIVLDHIIAQGRRNNINRIRQKSSRFQKMDIDVLLAPSASSDSLSFTTI